MLKIDKIKIKSNKKYVEYRQKGWQKGRQSWKLAEKILRIFSFFKKGNK